MRREHLRPRIHQVRGGEQAELGHYLGHRQGLQRGLPHWPLHAVLPVRAAVPRRRVVLGRVQEAALLSEPEKAGQGTVDRRPIFV